MALAVVTSGTQAATIGTEHTLSTQSPASPVTYLLLVDLAPLVAGDSVELRLYAKVLGTSTSRVAYSKTFTGPQTDPVALSVPIPITHQLVATLKQAAGTGRSFDWELVSL